MPLEQDEPSLEVVKSQAPPDHGDEPGFILNPPVQFQDRIIDFISIDLSKLSGGDLKQIEREYVARFKPDQNKSFFLHNNFLLLLWARVNDLDEAFFDKAPSTLRLQLTEFYKMRMEKVLGE
jgi:hypothetical protein